MGFWDWMDRYVNPFSGDLLGAFEGGRAAGEGVQRKVDEAASSTPGLSQVNQALNVPTQAVQRTVLPYAVDTIGTAANAIRWTYNNVISQPLTTAILIGNKSSPGAGEFGWGDPSRVFDGDEWSRSWRAAEHISPGQAILLRGATLNEDGSLNPAYDFQGGIGGPTATGALETAKPAYVTPDRSQLPEEFDDWDFETQQEYLKQAGAPIAGNALIEQFRQDSTFFKYSSGVIDFGINWYADPFILGGKALSALKRNHLVRPAPVTGWSHQEIQTLVNESNMVRTRDWIWANRDNPQLINNLTLVQRSAMGPRFGHIVSQLQSPDEVTDFIKVTMGDPEAYGRLATANERVAVAMAQDNARLSAIDLARSNYVDNPNLQALIDRQMDRIQRGINANADLHNRYNQILGQSETLDAINLTRWSTQRAERRTRAQSEYQAATARRAPRVAVQGTAAERAELTYAQREVADWKARVAQQRQELKDAPEEAKGAIRQQLDEAQDRLLRAQSMELTARTALSRAVASPVKHTLRPGSFYGTPINIVRSFNNYRPHGWVALDDITDDAIREVRANIARIPGIGPDIREDLLRQYLKAKNHDERRVFLQELDGFGLEQLAKGYGLTAKDAQDLLRAHHSRVVKEQERISTYSAAERIDPQTGARIQAHAFHDKGGAIVVAPNMVTKLQNSHVALDLDLYRKVLERNAPELRALRQALGKGADLSEHAAAWLTDLWKFGTLFRLGYIPRVLADDLAGQVARLGAASMALRFGWGVKNLATNIANSSTRGGHAAGEMSARQGIEYIDNELMLLRQERTALGGKADAEIHNAEASMLRAERLVAQAQDRIGRLPATARPATRRAAQTILDRRQQLLDDAMREHTRVTTTLSPKRVRVYDMDIREKWLLDMRAQSEAKLASHVEARTKRIQGSEGFEHSGQRLPGAFEGERGDFFKQTISAEQSVGNIFTTNKQIIHGNIARSFNHGAVRIEAIQNEALHVGAWEHAINAQIMQDELGRMAAQLLLRYGREGEEQAVAEMATWLRGPGKAYFQRLGRKWDTKEYIAANVWHEVNQYMPIDDIVRKALEPDGVNVDFLRRVMSVVDERPDVHVGQLGENLAGSNPASRALDRAMSLFYNAAATIPSNRLSRHPLFNQLYMGHSRRLVDQALRNQATSKLMQSEVDRITEAARRLAARDMKKLVFDISHRSDAVAAMRFISPFFAATTESWQRWARIIGDKPQVVGYAAKFFTAPLATGHAVDQDGNVINQFGKITDPVTGEERTIPKTERRILVRMPKWLAEGPIGKSLGADTSGTWLINQDSMNMVTQGDPWFNPGTGPMVQIPVNEFVKDKPTEAEVARHLGILPFGPEEGAKDFILPRTVKNLMTGFDSSDERYQQVRLMFLQKAAYEHDELGKPMPGLKEIDKQVREYWHWSAWASFTQPFASQKYQPYEFYRNQYQTLLRKHPGSPQAADAEFIDRYGESFLVFAQSMSDNKTGVAATKKAALLYQQHQDIIDSSPELAALIVGPEGNGPFSPEAYAYQLNNPIVTGGAEMQRSKISADDAMRENQKRRGWNDFSVLMNYLNSQVIQRGLRSIEDRGAEDLLGIKRGFVAQRTAQYNPDGTANEFYNEEWAKDYTSFNPQKYEQLIPGLEKVAFSDLANQKQRSDLRMLQNYIQLRKYVTGQLKERAAAQGTTNSLLSSRANGDLRQLWTAAVGEMIERDTRFGDLWSRYLSRDLGVDVEEGGESIQ